MKTRLRLLFLNSLRLFAVICAASLLATTPGHSASADRIARVESSLAPRLYAEGQPIKWTLQERMAHYRVPGVSIAVINEGKLEWARGYGTLEAGGAAPVNAETLFQAASISKPVSTLALLRLVEAGKLQLDQDVNDVLKAWKVPANSFTTDEKVTLRRMLSHTAGLTVQGFRGYAEDEAIPSVIQILGGEPPSNSGAIRVDLKPGTSERYSGGGYVVMHQLVRDVTGETFEHGGANEGFRCHLVAYASGRGCVIMTNADNGSALIPEIQRAIANEYNWPDYRPVARKSVPVDPEVLAGYVGSYRVPGGGGPTVTVSIDQNALAVDVDGRRANLIAESAQRFRVVDDETTGTFLTLSGKKALWAQNRFWLMLPGKTDQPPSTNTKSDAPTAGRFLVFRNTPSWRRPTDFEHVLRGLGHEVELKTSPAMADVDLSRYTTIIVPGAQPQNDFYPDYIRHAARFDDYVAKGGTLILELNGAEGTSLVLPRGVTMTPNGGLENAIVATNHPIFAPFGSERVIRANAASHGYLSGVPSEAIVLAVESRGSETFKDRPTFVEYTHGTGRVIAACQCFHDQDRSGRGPLMATVLDYAAGKPWVAGN